MNNGEQNIRARARPAQALNGHQFDDLSARIQRWIMQVVEDRDLHPPAAAMLGISFALDVKPWRIQALATDRGVSTVTIVNWISALQARGHLRIQWGPRCGGMSRIIDGYKLLLKDEQTEIVMTAREWWEEVRL